MEALGYLQQKRGYSVLSLQPDLNIFETLLEVFSDHDTRFLFMKRKTIKNPNQKHKSHFKFKP